VPALCLRVRWTPVHHRPFHSGLIMLRLRLQAKCTLGEETRLLHIGPNVTYAEMLEGVRSKFPNAPPFALKFLDR